MLYYETAKFLSEVVHDPAGGTEKQDLWAQIGRYTYSNFAKQTFGFGVRVFLFIQMHTTLTKADSYFR